MTSLFVRIRRLPFVIFLGLGLGLVCFSVHQTLHTALVARPVRRLAPLPPFPRAESPPVARAHEGWLIIRAWERAMDSLRRDSSGKRVYDSILAARPGILDSARKAEAFYYSHDH
jgi:hypothetical protein